jgi:hypothetical protein
VNLRRRLSVSLRLIQGFVSALGELLERVRWVERRKADADRCGRVGVLDRGLYRLESPASVVWRAVTQRAHELVTPDSDDRVIRAKVRLDRTDHFLQQHIACGMALAVVELFELINVDERDHKESGAVPCSVDLTLERDHSELAAQSAGERIELCIPQRLFRELAISRGRRAVCRGVVPVDRRASSFGGCAGTHIRRMVPRGFGGRARNAAVAVQSCGCEVALRGGAITRGGAEIAQVCTLITPRGVRQTLARGLRPRPGRLNPLERALDAIGTRGFIEAVDVESGMTRMLAVGDDLVSV